MNFSLTSLIISLSFLTISPAPAATPNTRCQSRLESSTASGLSFTEPKGVTRASRYFLGPGFFYDLRFDSFGISHYLPNSLAPFAAPDPTLWMEFKRIYATSPTVVSILRSRLQNLTRSLNNPGASEFKDLIKNTLHVGKLNFTITGSGVRLAPASWFFGKHFPTSDFSNDVRFAGEIWIDPTGVIYVSNLSGTFQPGANDLNQAILFLQSLFPPLVFNPYFYETP